MARAKLQHYSVDAEHLRRALRARREMLGLSMAELAAKAGVAPATVHKLESGKLSVHLDKFIQVLDALGMPFGDLVSFDGAALAVPADPIATRLAALLREKDQAALLEFLAGESRRSAGPKKAKRRPSE